MSCDYSFDPCLPDGSYNAQTRFKKTLWFTHTKNINETLQLGSYQIPIRIRTRSFRLDHTEGYDKTIPYLIYDLYGNLDNCAETSTSLWSITISENSVFKDSTVYIYDTENSNGFWKEDSYSVVFGGTSTDTTGFHHPSWTASKIKFTNINMVVNHTWKIMINGAVSTLFTETYAKPLYTANNPLIIVLPVPLSGQSTDPEIIEFGFYDFMVDGVAELDGGYDFYYPEWLRDYAGTYREADQADAAERWNDTQGTGSLQETVTRNVQLPVIHGPEDPRGSIVRDFAGNTLASVTVTKRNGELLHVNKLVSPSGTELEIPTTLPGDSIRYYPVGLI